MIACYRTLADSRAPPRCVELSQRSNSRHGIRVVVSSDQPAKNLSDGDYQWLTTKSSLGLQPRKARLVSKLWGNAHLFKIDDLSK